MILVDCDQRTPAWYAARAGVLCASEAADAWKKTRDGSESADTRDLKLRLACEQVTGEPEDTGDGYVNADMQRGLNLEPTARSAYQAQSGELVDQVGFVLHDTLKAGCSPDGLIGADGMLEIKCPRRATHLKWMRGRTLPPEHQIQCLHQLLVTGRAWVDFASYCEGFPPTIPALWVVRYQPDPSTVAEYQAKVERFLAEVERERASLLGWTVLTQGVTK